MQELISKVVKEISDTCCREEIFLRGPKRQMPQRDQIILLIEELRKVMFPGYFSDESDDYFLGHTLNRIWNMLYAQLKLAFSYGNPDAEAVKARAQQVCAEFFAQIPEIQRMLVKDVEAEFEGDPAAQSRAEVIFSYPGLFAIFVYRVAHELYGKRVPFIPRIMTEYAHSLTGIDINAGAQIGEYFFIDHGTGVVVGETTIIGDNVKLYQGATLGALSPAGMATNPNVRRHPKVGNNVVIYANSTLLGGATEIGDNVVVGGNAFLTSSVAPNTVVSVKNPEMTFRGKHHRG